MQLLCKQYQREVDGVAQGFEEQSLEVGWELLLLPVLSSRFIR